MAPQRLQQSASETETDIDNILTAEQLQQSAKWHFGLPKEDKVKKAKKSGETLKRLFVGFFFLSTYVIAYQISPLTMALNAYFLLFMCCFELLKIARNPLKDELAPFLYKQEAAILTLVNYKFIPKSVLTKQIMLNSGFSEAQNPYLFLILYQHHDAICIFLGVLLFIWVNSTMQRRIQTYILRRLSFVILLAFFSAAVTSSKGYVSLHGGRWWYAFPNICVAINDCGAYFAGKFFGRHKLIGLSPNKTVEGFIGGLLFSIVFTVQMLKCLEGNQFWTCAPMRIDILPFEDFQCTEQNGLYVETEFDVSWIGIEGFRVVKASPALIYSIIFCAFASLISPYAGFFGSGFKRAYEIKDFGDSLPGHGGYMDRLDCCSYMCIFAGMMV